MRLPRTEHTSRPWRIHELTRDFRLEDVWALPTPGGPDEFPELVREFTTGDPSQGSPSVTARMLWAIRWKLGELLGWDGPDAGIGARVPSLRDRLPADLRAARSGPDFDTLPFRPLYLLDDEFASEIANETVHGVLHLGWVPDGSDGHRGQMAVLVKPNGLLGNLYLAAIKPFRYLIVYPTMLREIELEWRARGDVTLPPGQRPVAGFPRFGTHLQLPPPAVPADPVIEIGGAVTESFSLPVSELATLPRRALTADFHCVAGWSATNLRWEGVAFRDFYRMIVEPTVQTDAAVTHLAFGGLDRYRSVVTIEDALAEDVLIADRLDGRPLDGDHGAPARLVSPSQYGFVSVKHLCRIELHTRAPESYGDISPLVQLTLRGPFKPHPRARVWEEERHGHLPNWLVRPVYRLSTPPIRFLSARGSSGDRDAGA